MKKIINLTKPRFLVAELPGSKEKKYLKLGKNLTKLKVILSHF